MKKSMMIALATVAVVYPLQALDAAPPNKRDSEKLLSDMADASTRWGISIVKGISQSDPGAKYLPAPVGDAAEEAISSVVNKYSKDQAHMQGQITILEGTANKVADTAAALTIAYTGGSGAIPVSMARAAIQAGTDHYFGAARDEASEKTRNFLALNVGKVLADSHLDYKTLQKLTPQEIKNALEGGRSTFKELDRKVSDPSLREFSRDLLVGAIVNTAKAQLDEITSQGAHINGLAKSIKKIEAAQTEFAKMTNVALKNQGEAISSLSIDVAHLDDVVAQIDSRLASQERNMAFVEDFVFSRMSPEEKANSLRRGYMAERFLCGTTNNCDQAKLKRDLIDRFDTEAKIEKTIQSAGKVLESANNLIAIANNLGFDTGSAGQVVGYGTVALGAFQAAASGNYLGAIAGLTGAFGKPKPDPMMSYLSAQFGQINAKLDTVIDNQRKLSEQISALSNRLDEKFKDLNGRVDVIDLKLETIRQIQAMTLNADWQSCQQLWSAAAPKGPKNAFAFDGANSTFPSVETASLFANQNGSNLDRCSSVISQKSASIAVSGWFGSFLDVRLDPSTPDADVQAVIADRADVWKIVKTYLDKHKIPLWRAYQSFAAPSATLSKLNERATAAIPAVDPCDPLGALADDRLRDLLCETTPGGGADAAKAAAVGLQVAMIPRHALDVSGWIMVESALVDVRAVRTSGAPVTALELARQPFAPGSITIGEQHVNRAMLTLDAAMANNSMLSGDLTTLAVLEALNETAIDVSAMNASELKVFTEKRNLVIRVLNAHPELSRNVAMAYLYSRLGIYEGAQRTTRNPSEKAYYTSLRFAEEASGGDVFAFLKSLFGADTRFEKLDSKKIVLRLIFPTYGDPGVTVSMPEPLSFKDGRLVYPSIVSELAGARDHVGVRLLDFGATRNLDREHRLALAATIARGEAP